MQGRQSMRMARALGSWIRRTAIMAGITVGMGAISATAAIIPLGIEEMVAHSDEVVSGRVAPEQQVMFTAGKIFTVSDFIVDESFKGNRRRGDVIQIAVPGGEIGTIGQIATNVAQLKPNEEVVLFLESRSEQQRENAVQTLQMAPDHPVLRSPIITGGPQGKFAVVKREEPTKVGDQVVAVREVTRVVREVPGRRIDVEDFPAIEDFGAAIRRIANGDVPIRRSVRMMPGADPVDIAERDPDAKALRVFDPVNVAPPAPKAPPRLPSDPARIADTPEQDARK